MLAIRVEGSVRQHLPKAIIPKKFNIQYTKKLKWPYAFGFPKARIVTSVSLVMGFLAPKFRPKANDKSEYARESMKYADMVAIQRQRMSW